MGDENIYRRKIFQRLLHVPLFIEKMPARFVAPGAIEPSKFQPLMLHHLQMQIFDGRMKWRRTVVVAFDRKNMPAQRHLRHAHDEGIRNVSATNQQIRAQLAVKINMFFVSNDQCSHALPNANGAKSVPEKMGTVVKSLAAARHM